MPGIVSWSIPGMEGVLGSIAGVVIRPRSDIESASQAAPRTADSTRRAPHQKPDLPR